jgi:hypothetical protein
MPTMETKSYPSCCTSSFCGSLNCEGCRHQPTLLAFRRWVREHDAKPADPVWSPNLFVAGK